ncbi:hypothetical protein QBC37DRAFT_378285 [Rhypophila decipiens]|uniref:Uncharacterized protein n=1 Tax=Rhypophila decipiens TaxID=261697 RepID=A0AAN7B3S8_9PEZI|nr:hypothetical protein QBC37DRAFT_378285 [Rhypophila decipiens]
MPITRKRIGPRGSEFWNALQVDDPEMLRVMIKEEFQYPDAASDIHYISSRDFKFSSKADSGASKPSNMIISLPCLQSCLVSLYRGAIHLQGDMGSSPITSTGHGHAIKNEEFLGLDRDIDIFILEQGPMRGVCAGRQKEITEEEFVKKQDELMRERHRQRLAEEREQEARGGWIWRRKKTNRYGKEKAWDKLLRKIKREPLPGP